MRIVPRRAAARSLIAVLLVAGLAGSAAAQYQRFRAKSPRVPERTDAGTWDGSYWYVNRDMRVGMWIRTTEGRPEVRLRVQVYAGPEEFTTDWNGEATYETRNGRGEFAMPLTQRGPDTIKGSWTWNLQIGKQVRRQLGEVTLYRAGIGREVVLLFNPYKFYIGEAGQERWQPVDQIWTFRKASKRLVRWEELPF